MRCAIYARFSSHMQNASSADDQVRLCREYAERAGWIVVDVHHDLAISGAVERRPGMTALLSGVAASAYDVVLAESIDRLGRDLGDLARLHQRLSFDEVALFTLADGRVSDLHIGLKGTMAKLELANLAARVTRGQIGAMQRGRVPTGRAYAYKLANVIRDDGSLDRGHRTIDPAEADTVRRIFAEAAIDRSARAIALSLNRDAVAGPAGKPWRAATIAYILKNPVYAGQLCYRRQSQRRDPETRRHVRKRNTPDLLVWADAPHLQIVDRKLWDQVQQLREARSKLILRDRSRPRHLLADKVRCGVCGGSMAVVTRTRLGCLNHRDRGTCAMKRRIERVALTARVFAGLRDQLLSPDAVEHMVREYHIERARSTRADASERSRLEGRQRAVGRAIANLLDAIEEGGDAQGRADLRARLALKTAERDALAVDLAELAAPSVIALHPGIAEAYRRRVDGLTTDPDIAADSDQGRALRELIDVVTVTPVPGSREWQVEFTGSLQAALSVSGIDPTPSRPNRTPVNGNFNTSKHGRSLRSFSV